VFSNAEVPSQLYCTYNVDASETRGQNTISIHRKKETNTLYTVNALNAIIRRVNNGVLDKTFQVDWNNYQNSFILTDGDDYRVVELVFFKKFTWD
tara:strand:+ start:2423 stop:2707 length:285 start_codon:yes stop_codon:yes gene_type:complete